MITDTNNEDVLCDAIKALAMADGTSVAVPATDDDAGDLQSKAPHQHLVIAVATTMLVVSAGAAKSDQEQEIYETALSDSWTGKLAPKERSSWRDWREAQMADESGDSGSEDVALLIPRKKAGLKPRKKL